MDFIAARMRIGIGDQMVDVPYHGADKIGRMILDWHERQTRLRQESDDRYAEEDSRRFARTGKGPG